MTPHIEFTFNSISTEMFVAKFIVKILMHSHNTFSPLFFIPARGGSKGVLRKNIRDLGGKPLIHWSIQAALDANLDYPIVVSSDDSDIISYVNQYENQSIITINRHPKYAEDHTPMVDVLQDLLSLDKFLFDTLYPSTDSTV